MPKAKKIAGTTPVPHYAMPDQSEPPYDLILEELEEYRHSQVGSSYFYIRAGENRCCLCRIVHGGGKIYFHEQVDCPKHGISDEDLEESVRKDPGTLALPGHHVISPHLEQKLRILYEE